MLVEPTCQDQVRAKARGEEAPAYVHVTTECDERLPREPDRDNEVFEYAATIALTELEHTDYRQIRFESVHEYVADVGGITGQIVYRYEWVFTAHK